MQHLATFHQRDVFPHLPTSDNMNYADRFTGKAILTDGRGYVALVGNALNDIYLLPGGGIDMSSDMRTEVAREVREETGCTIELVEEIGFIDDYRDRDQKHCITYCYTGKVHGSMAAPQLTEEEARIGMHTIWLPPTEARSLFARQVQALQTGNISFYNTGFNILRDQLFFLRATDIVR